MTHNHEKPLCQNRCRFTGDSSAPDGFCMVCCMTIEERDSMAALDASERAMLEYIVESRRKDLWMMWELVTEPTVQ